MNIVLILLILILVKELQLIPAPNYYSTQSSIQKLYYDLSIRELYYLPDQNSLVATRTECFTVKNPILDLNILKQVCIQNTAIQFTTSNPKGDLLFFQVYSQTDTLFVFGFTNGVIDSQHRYYYKLKDKTESFWALASISNQNVIALSIQQSSFDSVIFLKLPSSGKELILDSNMIQKISIITHMKWHPIDNQILVLGGYYSFGIYNLTSNIYKQIDQNQTLRVEIFHNGETILRYTINQTFNNQYQMVSYSYAQGQIQLVGSTSNVWQNISSIQQMSISTDDRILSIILLQLTQLRLYTLLLRVNQQTSKSRISFDSLYLSRNLNAYFAISPDGNQIIFYDQNQKINMTRMSRCIDGTYLLNQQCLNCSEKCRTCHKSANQCRSCFNTSFWDSQACVICNKSINGCIFCSNSSRCLSCSALQKFEEKPLENGKCQCSPGRYFDNITSTCLCQIRGCQECDSDQKCTKCNAQNRFELNKTSHQCECIQQYYFSSKSNSCELCSVKINNCASCWQINSNQIICRQCQDNYQTSNKALQCKCLDGHEIVDNKCVQKSNLMWLYLSSGGVVVLVIVIYLGYQLRKSQRKNKSLQQKLSSANSNVSYGTLTDQEKLREQLI